jgi:protein-tyrosine kinase
VSRIEHALEQAVKMREAQRAAQGDAFDETIASVKRPELPDHAAPPVFEAGDAAVDPAVVDRHLVSITDPHSVAAEQYKQLRARILKATRKDFHNTIMITSSSAGEGKSITAINLAVSLSQEINHTVLLVDADLRRPSLHEYLGLQPRYGLSEYLQGKMDLSDLLIKTGLGKLVILPGGNPSTRPAELLSSDRMKALVHEMKLRYKDRYVIFDSTPLLSTADALSLGNYMDGILFVIQGGRTSEKAATQTLSLMKGWNILGVVYNDVSPYLTRNVSHRYYRYYGYDQPSFRDTGK